MKIDNATRASALGETTATPARTAKQAPSPQGRGAAQDSVQLSSVSTQIQALETSVAESSGFDAAKVEAIKLAISEGRYTINAEAIADKLIASTRELLAQQG
jgi:negative regulator of flagellin synthesis FlgM